MAERKIFVSVLVDEDSILGKIAEMDKLAFQMKNVVLDLRSMLNCGKATESEGESAAESN